MKGITLIILTLLTTASFAQNFNQNPSVADSLRNIGLLKEAIDERKKDYILDPSDATNTYNLACALALRKQLDSAFHYLTIALEKDSSAQVLADPDFYFLWNDERWTRIEMETIKKVEAKHKPYPNQALSKELWRMRAKDQAFYYELKLTKQQFNGNAPLRSAIWELKHLLNIQNQQRLTEIIDEYGWPANTLVGNQAARAAFLVVQHADLDYQLKYLPLMQTAAEMNEASWSSLALLIDRTNLRQDKKQIYGTQVSTNEAGEFDITKLLEPAYVNQRRKSVGLMPIERYLSFWDIEWKVEQKTREE